MNRIDLRNLALVVLAAALCLGGSFVCTSHHDEDPTFTGFVHVNAILP
jgi:hypothetical protein